MAATPFQPGQRWVSNTESELGLGMVLAVTNRRVELSFPAADEKRAYAIDIAPLSRVRYDVGQRVSDLAGNSLLITGIEEHNGCLIYLGTDENDQVKVLPELELNSFVQFNKPQERLFAGQIDKNRAFQLRLDTLRYQRQLQKSSVAGLLGARIQLLPHQLYIADETARRYAPRVLLADEVGLGKTIEAGLIIHQQLITGRAKRVLITVPDSLVHQWLVEMLRRFNLYFTIMDRERFQALNESGHENPFESAQLILCGLSFFNEQADHLPPAVCAEWDLLVVDEAHHLEWSDQHASPAYRAIEALSQQARGLLLLTATPEQLGIEGHFARLRLLDPARYFDIEQFRQEEARYAPVNKLVKQLLADNGAERLTTGDFQAELAGFLGTPALEALNTQLKTTDAEPTEVLNQIVRELLDRHGTGRVLFRNTRAGIEGFPRRVLEHHLLPAPAELIVSADGADDALETLMKPEMVLGDQWLQSDPRVAWLVDFLQAHRGHKILVICSMAKTAVDLEQYLNLKQGVHSSAFHEGLSLVARDRAAAYFADEEQGAQVLICSEIGSEGRNFQFSNQLVLFDLPLNPDLLEQRIGRLDRFGQRHDVHIHVPCYRDSAQHILLRWYHEGINAFASTCAIGQSVFHHFKQQLEYCLRHPDDLRAADAMIEQSSAHSEEVLTRLQAGRDRLLELNSFDNQRAMQIVDDIHAQEDHHALAGYMERIFDQFGVEQEHHSATSVVLKPGDHMLEHSFPELPEDGLTATYRRETALSREDFHYLSWEHPMVTGAMDMVINGEYGNTALCSLKLPPLKPGTILLETIFTTHCAAPANLQIHRYLPLTTTRIVVDSKNNNLSKILTEKHFNTLGKRVRRHSAQDFIRHSRKKLHSMLEAAEKFAALQEKSIVDAAVTRMENLQQSELTRLQALAEHNPNIRQEEIDYLETKINELHRYLDSAQIKLEALRVAVVVA